MEYQTCSTDQESKMQFFAKNGNSTFKFFWQTINTCITKTHSASPSKLKFQQDKRKKPRNRNITLVYIGENKKILYYFYFDFIKRSVCSTHLFLLLLLTTKNKFHAADVPCCFIHFFPYYTLNKYFSAPMTFSFFK